MKKIILMCTVMFAGLLANAQNSGSDSVRIQKMPMQEDTSGKYKHYDPAYEGQPSMKQDNTRDEMQKGKVMTDRVLMREGKLWLQQGGKTTLIENDYPLLNGIVIMKNGSVKTKDGKIVKLKEGDMVDMNGKVTSQSMPDNKM